MRRRIPIQIALGVSSREQNRLVRIDDMSRGCIRMRVYSNGTDTLRS